MGWLVLFRQAGKFFERDCAGGAKAASWVVAIRACCSPAYLQAAAPSLSTGSSLAGSGQVAGRRHLSGWLSTARVASSSLQSGKIASKHIALTRSRILRRSNLLHLKGPAGATCLAKCPMSQTLIFAAEMYYVHTALEFVFSDPLREISSKIDSCSLTATFSRASFALRFEGTK